MLKLKQFFHISQIFNAKSYADKWTFYAITCPFFAKKRPFYGLSTLCLCYIIMRFQGKDVRGKSSKHLYFVRSTFIRKSWELTFISETLWGQVRRSLQKYFLKYSVDHPLEGAILTEAIQRMFRSLPLPPLICSPNTQLSQRVYTPGAWGKISIAWASHGFSVVFNALPTTLSQVFGAPKAKSIQVGFLLELHSVDIAKVPLAKRYVSNYISLGRWKVSFACRQVSRNM